MAPTIERGASTPKSHPIHGIYMPREAIDDLVQKVIPGAKVVSVTQLPSGQSFNNRIYFLEIRNPGISSSTSEQRPAIQLVLKVNGRFFGANKVQNEVACLQLLETYCPSTPSPKVWAWAAGGDHFNVVGHLGRPGPGIYQVQAAVAGDSTPRHWILMTRMPGETLSTLELGVAALREVGMNVAVLVGTWRQAIPHQGCCGNILLSDIGELEASSMRMTVRGMITEEIPTTAAMTTDLQYYEMRLREMVWRLESKDYLKPNQHTAVLINSFITTILPRLQLLIHPVTDNSFVFTHYDLSPRNILVTTSPDATVRISGIIDFEFAGFFPPLDEFVNDYVDNGGDWPAPAYEAYLARLAELGVATPANGTPVKAWEQAHWLGQMLENIAPWWLPGGFVGEDLEKELGKAEGIVRAMLQKLEGSVDIGD